MKRLNAAVLFEVLLTIFAFTACGGPASTPGTSAGAADVIKSPDGPTKSFDSTETLPPYPDPSRFAAWNSELRQKDPGRDTVLVDLDAVDHNIALVRATLGPQFALRIVTKSLPSSGLIQYIMREAGTNKVMTFSEGVLAELLDDFGWSMDALQGRPMPVEGAERLLIQYSAAANVRWLVDTVERANEYAALAKRLHGHLKVAVEIDVGLRRGGAIDTTDLLNILAVIDANKKYLSFAGFMGYDGHVPYAPAFGFDADTEFAAVQQRYTDFFNAGATAYPQMFSKHDLVFNSGGTVTYYRYTSALVDTPVNDMAMGSGFLMPGDFQVWPQLASHYPAAHLAVPVLKRIVPAEVPFVQGYLPAVAAGQVPPYPANPLLQVAFFMQSGPGPTQVVYPPQHPADPEPAHVDGRRRLHYRERVGGGPGQPGRYVWV